MEESKGERTMQTPPTEEEGLLEIDISTLIKAVMTRWRLVAGICGTVIVLALAYCFLATPIYQATCRMLVEPGTLKVTNIQDVYDSEFGSDAKGRDAFLMTQIETIKSDHILARVFERFHLGEKKEFEGVREPLKALEELVVIKQIPNTYLIDIGFKWDDARFSAEVSNYIADIYMQDSQQRASGFSQRGLEKLQEELLNMEKNRISAIETLNAYKRKNNILSVESSQQLGIARLTKLDEARVSAEEALASAEATVSSIALWRKEGRRLDSIPEAIQNPTLAAFKSAKLKAQSDLLQTLIDFGPGHKSVRIQQQIIGDMNQAIAQETENSLVSAQAKLEQAKVRVSIISADQDEARKELMALDQIADEYRMLEDRLKAAESAYRLVLQRVNELYIAKSADSGTGGTFQILVPATPPMKPAYPEKAKIMIISTLAAGLFSVMLCLVLELLDSTLKRKEGLESISRVPVFGFIPHVDAAKADFVTREDSRGQGAEAFRALRTSLSLSESGRKARIITVTSSVTGEGKTFLSLNLAIANAQAGKRVLIIDADMHKHRLSSVLNESGPSVVGLSNLLAEDVRLEERPSVVTQPFADLPLYFLPSGPLAPNPGELLSGPMTAPLLKELLGRFDLIIIDAPPVLSVSDARILAGVPDMAFLVAVRLLLTDKRQLKMTMEALRTVNARIIGTIMNYADVTSSSSYGYGYGYKYYAYGYGNKALSEGKKAPWWKRLIHKAS